MKHKGIHFMKTSMKLNTIIIVLLAAISAIKPDLGHKDIRLIQKIQVLSTDAMKVQIAQIEQLLQGGKSLPAKERAQLKNMYAQMKKTAKATSAKKLAEVSTNIKNAEFEKLTKKEQEFVKKHEIRDERVIAILDATFKDTTDIREALAKVDCTFFKNEADRNVIAIHPALPEFVIKASRMTGVWSKRNISRVEIAERAQDCVKKYNLQHIVIPKKYLYHIPGRPFTFENDNWIVLAEKLSLMPIEKSKYKIVHETTVAMREEIDIIRKRAGFVTDFHEDNVVFTTDGKIAIVDFELRRSVDLIGRIPGLHFFAKPIARLVAKHKLARLYKHSR